MTLQELKTNILENTLEDDFLILQCEENYFIADQYIKEICEIKQLQKRVINSLSEIDSSALSLVFDFSENALNILKVDEFDEISQDYSRFKNTVVICNKVDKQISAIVENYIVKIPKLLDWQVKDYIKTLCTGLEDLEIDWLYTNTNKNIYKIDNELSKIKLFEPAEQLRIFNEIRFAKNSDLYLADILKLSEAAVKKDYVYIYDYLKHKQYTDFDPMALTNLMLGTFKKILYVNYSAETKLTAEALEMSPKQYKAISYYYKNFSREYLCTKIKFLSEIDLKLKSNLLDLPKEQFIDYVICGVIS